MKRQTIIALVGLLAVLSACHGLAAADQPLPDFVQILSKGLRYEGKGSVAFPEAGRHLVSDPSENPKTFLQDFVVKFDSQNDKFSYESVEKDGYGKLMRMISGGSNGESHYLMDHANMQLVLSSAGAPGETLLTDMIGDLELLTFPFGFTSSVSASDTAWLPQGRSLAGMEKALGELAAARAKGNGESNVSIPVGESGVVWKFKFEEQNLYPSAMSIFQGNEKLVDFRVAEWGDSLGLLKLPKRIEHALYRSGTLVRTISFTVQSLEVKSVANFNPPLDKARTIRDVDTDTVFQNGR